MIISIPRNIIGLVLFCTWVMSRQAQSYIFYTYIWVWELEVICMCVFSLKCKRFLSVEGQHLWKGYCMELGEHFHWTEKECNVYLFYVHHLIVLKNNDKKKLTSRLLCVYELINLGVTCTPQNHCACTVARRHFV